MVCRSLPLRSSVVSLASSSSSRLRMLSSSDWTLEHRAKKESYEPIRQAALALVCSLTLTSPRQSAVHFWIVPVANMMITDRARTEPSARSVAPQALVYHRSEEHTSELQSLLRHTYADFCLQK